MIKRTFSTILLWALVLGIPYYFGPQGAIWVLALASLLSQMELYKLLEKMGFAPKKSFGYAFGTFLILGSWYIPNLANTDVLTVAIIATSITVLFKPEFDVTSKTIMPTLLGFLLIPFMLNAYGLILEHYHNINLTYTGMVLTCWLIAVSKFTDVGGLLIGSGFGKHKLAPEISPGKTWEGAIGGIFLASLLGAMICIFAQDYVEMPQKFTPLVAGLMAIPVALTAIASDLIESLMKRKAGVKDSGNIIPGIGGVFDLTDSLLLSAPVGFLFFKYLVF